MGHNKLTMKVVAALVVVACFCGAVGASNIVCGKGTTTKTVTMEEGEAYTFKTQKGKRYKGNTNCAVEYKMGGTCGKMSFVCTKFNTNNKDKKRCKKGDTVTVTASGKAKAYCKTKKPKVTSTGDMSVVFTSDAKKSGTGAVCKVKCTEAAGGTVYPTPALSDCQCGLAKRKTKIVGGKQTEVNEYPWQVGIVNKGQTSVFCGASLISDRWILSAAHCFHDESSATIQVLLGEHDYSSLAESDMLKRNIEKIVDHPNYDKQTSNYDFSLMKLAEPIDFSSYTHIRPICLPENGDSDYANFVSTVTGWGTTSLGGSTSSKLLEVDVNVMTNSECQNNYAYPSSWITDQMLCAIVEGGGKDACQGDSGGPLVTAGAGNGVAAGQNYEQIGVVSWGSGCAGADSPGVYSRVTEQLGWITTTTADAWSTCPRN